MVRDGFLDGVDWPSHSEYLGMSIQKSVGGIVLAECNGGCAGLWTVAGTPKAGDVKSQFGGGWVYHLEENNNYVWRSTASRNEKHFQRSLQLISEICGVLCAHIWQCCRQTAAEWHS